VTALFSGLITKVGVYAIFRIYAVVYDGDPAWQGLVIGAAVLSMLVGALGAVGEHTFRAILVFGMVSHIGYMMVGPALFTQLALSAAIFYFIHHVLVKAALLMCAGAVEITYGTGHLERLGGLANRAPLLATTFMVAGSSLAGVPPLSGFVAKFTIIRAGVVEGQWLLAAVAAAAGLLTLLAMIKVWNSVFWGHDGEGSWDATGTPVVTATRVRTALVLPATVLASFSILLGVGAQPLLTAAGAAAAGLLDTSAYVTAVIGP
jgi:multicomponent Na+:H+ antiporter subunit D